MRYKSSPYMPDERQETTRERAERQRQERRAELTYTAKDYKRWAENRERVIAEREKAARVFELGWMQSPTTQSQNALWENIFTAETKEDQKQYIKSCNTHLNEPVREGEIVVLPTKEPTNSQEQNDLNDLLDQAKVASIEIGKLMQDEVATLNRHFDLFSYQLEERIKADGLPNDYYAQVSTGVGATTALVEQNLKNIQGVLLEINDLYLSQVAMASRTGGMNYGPFISERMQLFKKLDGSFAMLSKRSVQLPIYTQIKRNLKLSTKSVVHNADDILKSGAVKNLGTRIANISIGISAARGLGYIGLLVGAQSGLDSIHKACKVDEAGNCGKTTTREVIGFVGGFYGGAKVGTLGTAAAVTVVEGIALVIGVSASAPVLAIAAIGGAIIGGAIGGIAGSTTGKAAGDIVYEWVF